MGEVQRERKIFAKQKPIDDARLSLLRSAVIGADSNLEPPRRHCLRVLQSRRNLASMLEKRLRHLVQINMKLKRETKEASKWQVGCSYVAK